jgi:DNA-binding MarR family transcriptional regulator
MDRLVERALAIRRIDPDDKRSIIAALSVLGQSLAERLSRLESSLALGW